MPAAIPALAALAFRLGRVVGIAAESALFAAALTLSLRAQDVRRTRRARGSRSRSRGPVCRRLELVQHSDEEAAGVLEVWQEAHAPLQMQRLRRLERRREKRWLEALAVGFGKLGVLRVPLAALAAAVFHCAERVSSHA